MSAKIGKVFRTFVSRFGTKSMAILAGANGWSVRFRSPERQGC
jgi:hypothetical protein